MARITPSLSTRVDARGKSEILLRFVGGRYHIYRLHSRIFITPSRWKDGAVVIPRLETAERRELLQLRSNLDGLVAFLLTEFQEADQVRVDGAWMQDAVDRYHHPNRRQAGSFFFLMDEFFRSKDVGAIRRRKYDVTRRALERFQDYRRKPLTVEDFDVRAVEEFKRRVGAAMLLALISFQTVCTDFSSDFVRASRVRRVEARKGGRRRREDDNTLDITTL